MKSKFLNQALTFDCGLHTAAAYWDGTNKPKTCYFYKNDKLSFECRNFLVERFEDIIHQYRKIVNNVYIEGTQKYNTLTSQIAIQKGSLFELSYLVGRYEQICYEYSLNCKIINASVWKG